jgi:hypothetical protein
MRPRTTEKNFLQIENIFDLRNKIGGRYYGVSAQPAPALWKKISGFRKVSEVKLSGDNFPACARDQKLCP